MSKEKLNLIKSSLCFLRLIVIIETSNIL